MFGLSMCWLVVGLVISFLVCNGGDGGSCFGEIGGSDIGGEVF